MKAVTIAFLASSMALASLEGGTLKGTVRAQGKKEVEDLPEGAYESRKFKFAERVNYAEFRDFVVYVDQSVEPKPIPPSEPLQVVTQKDATFNPHVLPILVGTTVQWPNHDEIFHNVFSYSEAKPFDLGLYKQQVTPPVKFDKPGRVDVFCSIHSKMHCIILVLENPFFAKTDAKGNYSISGLPPGHYRLKAWHERMPPLVKEITVPEEGELKVDFVLGIQGLPKN